LTVEAQPGARTDTFYFDTPTGIERIKADGGARDKVATPDTAHHEAGFAWPEVLPHGKGLLLRMRPDNGDAEQYRIVVVDLRTRERHELVQGVFARYATPGYLVFATADGRLFVVPFDQDKLAVRGLPTEVLDGLGVHVAGGVDLSISAPGTLAYTTRSVAGSRRLVWVSRDGASLPVDTDLGDVLTGPGLSLSPDGRSLAVGRFDDTTGRADIWVKRLDHGPFSRLTFEGRLNGRPVWAPDGRSILFISYGVGTYSGALYARSEDGGGSRKMLASADRSLQKALVSSDGRWIIVRTGEPEPGGGDILVMHAGVDSAPRPLLATKFTEAAPTLSPDEHWLAYTSNESGRREVYVRPFPEVNTARWQISSAGGTEPRWAHSGRELFYRNGAGEMVAAQVTTRSAFSLGQQQTLFSARTFVTDGSHRAYDVSPDDQRFIMIASDAGDDSGELILVQNWFEELKAKVKNAGH
jgi:serine/threonine-protein kinase